MAHLKPAAFSPTPLGVGMVYFPALDFLFEHCSNLLDVIEIEPQTLWFRSPGTTDAHRLDDRAFERVIRLPQHKLIHGVGLPLAASEKFESRQIPPWKQSISRLNPPWISEHLAFMRIPNKGQGKTSHHSGFLLPPLQCRETMDIAIARIAEFRKLSAVPVAFEIPPNYLRPQPGEIPDGDFFAQIATAADCGIVLDIHNLWCNERNGRQKMQDVLESLPLDRIWEIHLAGGDSHHGYWLDAHSDLVPQPVMEFCEEWLPRLPNAGALIFEIMPVYVHAKKIPVDRIATQLDKMKSLWHARQKILPMTISRSQNPVHSMTWIPEHSHNVNAGAYQKVVRWEQSLGEMVNGRSVSIQDIYFPALVDDPAIPVYRTLIESFRSGTLVEGLPLSYRLLALTLGENVTYTLMKEFWSGCWPEPFAYDEMLGFSTFLHQKINDKTLSVNFLDNVLNYEIAVAQAQMSGLEQFVPFDCEPIALLEALSRWELPASHTPGKFEVQVPAWNMQEP